MIRYQRRGQDRTGEKKQERTLGQIGQKRTDRAREDREGREIEDRKNQERTRERTGLGRKGQQRAGQEDIISERVMKWYDKVENISTFYPHYIHVTYPHYVMNMLLIDGMLYRSCFYVVNDTPQSNVM